MWYHRLQLGSSRTHLMKCRVLNKQFQVSDTHWALCSIPAANCLGPKLLSQDPLPVGETEKRERFQPASWLFGSKMMTLWSRREAVPSANTRWGHFVFKYTSLCFPHSANSGYVGLISQFYNFIVIKARSWALPQTGLRLDSDWTQSSLLPSPKHHSFRNLNVNPVLLLEDLESDSHRRQQ